MRSLKVWALAALKKAHFTSTTTAATQATPMPKSITHRKGKIKQCLRGSNS